MKMRFKKFTNTILTGILVSSLMISCGGKEEETTEETETTTETEEAKSEITLSKTEFKAGEVIEINYKAVEELGKKAWIGIIPADKPHGSESDNDKYDLSYQYFKDAEGTLTFKAPKKAGEYDFRMHTTDSNGEEIAASEVFTVVVTESVTERKYGAFAEGVTVAAKWTNGSYYSAVITKANDDGTYDVDYDDGTKGKAIAAADMIELDPNLKLNVGDKVQGVWSGARFYKGTVEKIDGTTVIIKWDDGSKPSGVELGQIFKQ